MFIYSLHNLLNQWNEHTLIFTGLCHHEGRSKNKSGHTKYWHGLSKAAFEGGGWEPLWVGALFMILVLIRRWRLSTACGLVCHINKSISAAGSCPQRQQTAWKVDQTAVTHCYSKLHQSCPHSHRSRHRNDCWPHSAGCSRAWNPSDSSCWLNTMKFINVLEMVERLRLFPGKTDTGCFLTVIFSRLLNWFSTFILEYALVSYHSIASSHLIYPCSGLNHHRLAGSWCIRRSHTQTQCGCCRRSFLLQKTMRAINRGCCNLKLWLSTVHKL